MTAASGQIARLTVRVRAVRYESQPVRSYELVDPGGAPLPAFSAGAHLDLHIPTGLVRSYSLCNDQEDRDRYVIAVNRDPASRGGSAWIHERLRPGDLVEVSRPRNNFALAEDAAASVLIAGGIGVTPLLAMARRLHRLRRNWDLVYAVRNRACAALIDDLTALDRERVHLHADDEAGRVLDVASVVRAAPAGAHLYACGPAPMMGAFEAATADLPAPRRHVEYFTTSNTVADGGGFDVVLARSAVTIRVQPGQTILQALEKKGIDVPFSCTEGVCGTCQTRVLAGLPDHRDLVLSDTEKARNDSMMVCCSGSLGPRLELDL